MSLKRAIHLNWNQICSKWGMSACPSDYLYECMLAQYLAWHHWIHLPLMYRFQPHYNFNYHYVPLKTLKKKHTHIYSLFYLALKAFLNLFSFSSCPREFQHVRLLPWQTVAFLLPHPFQVLHNKTGVLFHNYCTGINHPKMKLSWNMKCNFNTHHKKFRLVSAYYIHVLGTCIMKL